MGSEEQESNRIVARTQVKSFAANISAFGPRRCEVNSCLSPYALSKEIVGPVCDGDK